LKAPPPERLKEICEAGEAAAREYILSKLERKLIRSLDIEVTSETGDGITFNIDLSVELEPGIEIDLDEMTDEASEAALSAIDRKMKGRKRVKAT
jgi:hypothetical protein